VSDVFTNGLLDL